MTNIKKIKTYFLLIILLISIFSVDPSYSLTQREDSFRNALDLSSRGNFNLALKEWNIYLNLFNNDAAAFSNRGNVKLIIGDIERPSRN